MSSVVYDNAVKSEYNGNPHHRTFMELHSYYAASLIGGFWMWEAPVMR